LYSANAERTLAHEEVTVLYGHLLEADRLLKEIASAGATSPLIRAHHRAYALRTASTHGDQYQRMLMALFNEQQVDGTRNGIIVSAPAARRRESAQKWAEGSARAQ
jgi:hypothetical protein